MKNTTKILALILLTGLMSFKVQTAEAPAWEVDKSHSSINFEINHFFTPVSGRFDSFTGSLNFNPEDLAASSANFTVQVSSVNTENERRDGHLQSGDFFDAEKWPEMTFTSTSIESKGDKKYVANGKLTIRDVTKEIALPFEILGMMEHPMKKGKQLVGIKAETTINRNDYGVGTGSWAATAVVGGDVKITVFLEASRSL